MRNKIVYAILGIAVLIIGISVLSEKVKPKVVDWRAYYYNTKTSPYGTYITYELLPELFPNQKVKATRRSIPDNLESLTDKYIDYYEEDFGYDDISDNSVLSKNPELYNDIEIEDEKDIKNSYIFINGSFYLTSRAQTLLLGYVGLGNNVFVAANSISNDFLEQLGVESKTIYAEKDTICTLVDYPDRKYHCAPNQDGSRTMLFPQSTNASNFRTLAKDGNERTIFARVKYGRGCIYIHTNPVLFTNIEMKKEENADLVFRSLSYLPADNDVLWDEYFKQGGSNEESDASLFSVIFRSEALTYAFWIVIISLLLFVLFKMKRTQRIIPIIVPPANLSVEYLDTIGNLYYRMEEHRANIEQRHGFFLEYIRTNYNMGTENVTEEFIKSVSRKSRASDYVIRDLCKLHEQAKRGVGATENDFKRYNSLLEEFYRVAKNK